MCGGHVLLEDVPGTAKTVLARAIGGSIDGVTISRIQCTPDLQPTDVTGMSVFDQKTRDFEFRPGPIFTNVLLVDEINRATPKTQSALLEAMAEGQVTVDGVTMQLPSPFFLLATDNPIEYEGTFPLPEAQLDRFLLRTALGYPGVIEERRILEEQRYGHPLAHLQPVVGLEDVQELREAAQHVYVDEVLHNWIVDLVRATRELDVVSIGSSVRGSLAVERVARAWALAERPRLRRPRGRRAALRARARAPRRLHARARRPRARRRLARRDRGVPPGVPRARSSPRLRRGPAVPRAALRGRRVNRAERRQPDLPARPPPPPDRADPRHDAERSPRARLRGRRLASVPPRRRHPLDRLGRLGAALVRARPGRVRRPRALRGRGAAGRRRLRPPAGARPSTGRRCRGSTRARRCGRRSRSCSRAPRAREASSATSTTPTASRTGCRRAASAGSRTSARSGSTRPGGARPRTASSARSSTSSSTARQVTAGSFVFVLSDFLDAPSRETWLTAVEHLWDVVPVVIQDPTWEQSFPDVSGIVVPLRDPRTGRVTHVRLTRKEAAARKRAHEERLRGAARRARRCSTSTPS